MTEYEQTASVDAEPDELFDYLADVHHLPEYFPMVVEAELAGEEEVDVRVEDPAAGDTHPAHGWLHVDGLERRMEWGATDGPYHGWLQVDPGDVGGSLITVHVSLNQELYDHAADAEEELTEAMENIRRLAGAGAA